jgi:hypothetical protein
MAAVRTAMRQVLTGHEPFPAAVVDLRWNLVEANTSVAPFFEGVAAELLAPPANVLRLSLHPGGLAPHIINLGEWRGHLLARLRRQIDIVADPDLAELYDELHRYPCDQPVPEVEIPGPGEVAVPLRLRRDGHELSFISTVSTFGTPLDVTVAELAIESFFPADSQTAGALRRSNLG